jgi:hypothetical protein
MKCLLAALCVLLLRRCHALLADDSPEAPFAAMSPAEARAYERDTLRRVADLALIPPVLNTSPLPKYDYDKLDYGMTIGIERTPKGRLWACWVAGGDSPKAFFVLATSDDDGETWSKPRLVVDSQSTKDRSANGTSASVGLAGRIMRSNRRSWSGRVRPDRGGTEELPIHAQGRIFPVGSSPP